MNLIKPHPSWDVVDSSKIDAWLDCPRMFFFKHVVGWTLDQPKHDLWFGESWHHAREYQLIHGYEAIPGAYSKFIDHYRKEFPQETDDIYRPKDPSAVALALQLFADQRRSDLVENEVLMTECSGTVPINFSGRVLYYRMDSVLRNRESGKIFSWDHKSAKRFSTQWADKFHLSVQNGTYTHCLYCLYPIHQVLGVEFCGTSFGYMKRGSAYNSQGYKIELQRVPAFKTPDQMNTWLWTVNDIYDDIEREFDRLMYCKESDSVMMAFPMNTNSCTKYFGCMFHDYCMAWQNPINKAEQPPLGFRVEFWDPRDMKTTHKKDLSWPTDAFLEDRKKEVKVNGL